MRGIPGNNSQLSCSLAHLLENFFQKNMSFQGRKCIILEENVLKLIHLIEIKRNYWKNWVKYNILQIYLTKWGRFPEKFLQA